MTGPGSTWIPWRRDRRTSAGSIPRSVRVRRQLGGSLGVTVVEGVDEPGTTDLRARVGLVSHAGHERDGQDGHEAERHGNRTATPDAGEARKPMVTILRLSHQVTSRIAHEGVTIAPLWRSPIPSVTTARVRVRRGTTGGTARQLPARDPNYPLPQRNRESEVSIHAHEPTMWGVPSPYSAVPVLPSRFADRRASWRSRPLPSRASSTAEPRRRPRASGDAAVGDAGFPTIIVGAGVVPFAMDAATSALRTVMPSPRPARSRTRPFRLGVCAVGTVPVTVVSPGVT